MRSSLLLLSLATVTAPLPAQDPVDCGELAAAIAWFDTLGYPSVADKPFVAASVGAWFQSGNEPKQPVQVSGFLLRDEGKEFTILTLALDERTFERTPSGTDPLQRVGYSVEPLRGTVDKVLAAVRAEQSPSSLHFDSSWDGLPGPSLPVSLFFLARALHEAGGEELALELADAARRGFRKGTVGTLRDLLTRDLAHVSMWRLILEFGNGERSFADLLADCERLLRQFPDSEHFARAEQTRDLLRRMVKEEQEREPLAGDADEDARIEDLVFRLRDQNGKQWSQPGACDVFADPRGEESPAHRLVKHGNAAVPFLLTAFDDDSFTRSMGFHRNFYFSHEVLRVRDVAAAVFERITGSRATDRAGAERIWRRLEQRGGRAVLIEGTEQGNHEHARRLVLQHPDAALEAIRKAIAAANHRWQRERLIGLVAGVPGDGTEALLRAALRPENAGGPSVTAAVALFLHNDRDAAVDAMIEAWRLGPEGIDARRVSGFLATCGARRAIAALAATPDRLDDDAIRTLGHGNARLPHVLRPDGSGTMNSLEETQFEDGTEAAIEQLLAGRLVVERRSRGNYGGTIDPAIRDFAAQALNARWPERYAFDFEAPRQTRALQILKVRNVWRERQGLEPLPLPRRPRIPEVDPTTLEELFTNARLEGSDVARHALLDRIEALGLGALPAVTTRADEVRDPERRREWAALASRIASHVRAVRLAEGSAPFPAGLEDQALAMRGSRLDPEALVDLLCAVGRGGAQFPARVSLLVTRASDGTGVVVEFAFARAARGSAEGVRYSAAVTSGRRGLCGSTGAGVRRVADERNHYEDFAKALSEGVAAPATVPLDASYEMDFE